MSAAWDFNSLQNFQQTQLSHSRLFQSSPKKGPTLLLVHGGFHGAWCWTQFLNYFELHEIPAAAIDLRGHGGLTQGPSFLSEGVREAVLDVCEAAHMLRGPIVLVGHSLGALIAMAAAETLSLAGLVMLAPSPPGQIPGLRKLPERPADQLVMPPGEDRARSWFLSGYSGTNVSDFMTRLCPESPAMINDRYRLRVSTQAEWVKGPSLCLSAGKDDKLHNPPGQDKKVAEFYNADFQILPDAGHCFMLDDTWEQAAASIVNWLRQKLLIAL